MGVKYAHFHKLPEASLDALKEAALKWVGAPAGRRAGWAGPGRARPREQPPVLLACHLPPCVSRPCPPPPQASARATASAARASRATCTTPSCEAQVSVWCQEACRQRAGPAGVSHRLARAAGDGRQHGGRGHSPRCAEHAGA